MSIGGKSLRPQARSCTPGPAHRRTPVPGKHLIAARAEAIEVPAHRFFEYSGPVTLYDETCTRKVTKRPFAENRRRLEQRLTPEEYEAVCEHIDGLINGAGKEIVTAGWLPGADWSRTPLEVLCTKAARHDEDIAAKLFGLIVYLRIMDHEDDWASGRYQVQGRDIGSRTYFKITKLKG